MRTPKIVLLVPAHNEEVGIVATMESVEAQTMSPDRRIVICDNCTDATPGRARARAGGGGLGAVGNPRNKGGARKPARARVGQPARCTDASVAYKCVYGEFEPAGTGKANGELGAKRTVVR